MSLITLLGIGLVGLGAWLWTQAPAMFAAIREKARAGELTVINDVDEANANAWASAASLEAGTRRLRIIAVTCIVAGAVVAWLGMGA